MGIFNGKKNDKKAELSKEEIDQLKQQLSGKIAEYRAIYKQLVDAGGIELPEEILESVTGGLPIGMTPWVVSGTTDDTNWRS